MFRRRVIGGSHEHISPDNHGHLFPVRGNSRTSCPGSKTQRGDIIFRIVTNNIHFHFLGTSGCIFHVYFTVITKTQTPVTRNTQETHGVSLERSLCLHGRRISHRERVHVKRIFPLTQKIYPLFVRRQHGRTIFPRPINQTGMFPTFHIIAINITCDRRGMMFTPFILPALFILVQESITRFEETNLFRRGCQYLPGTSPIHRYGIQFGHGTCRK